MVKQGDAEAALQGAYTRIAKDVQQFVIGSFIQFFIAGKAAATIVKLATPYAGSNIACFFLLGKVAVLQDVVKVAGTYLALVAQFFYLIKSVFNFRPDIP